LDLDSFREVCNSYSELFQIGFKIFDETGEMLVDVKGASADLCSYLFTLPEGKALCTREVSAIRGIQLDYGELTYHDCFTGQRYVVAPIVHEGSLIGRMVYGPYLPANAKPPELPPLGEKFKPEVYSQLRDRLRRAQNEVVRSVVRHLVQMIEVMLYIGYKHALTSRMHVEAVTASYSELQDKNHALRKSYERLKELDRLKSNFLATVSHELRTPLNSVIGYSEMLLEGLAGQLSAEQSEYVGTIMEKGEQLLGLISGILDFSKIESGNLSIEKGQTDLNEIANSAVSTCMPLARKNGVSIEFIDSKDIPVIQADRDKILQVMINIIGNAVKFNRKDGKVSIRADRFSGPHQKDDKEYTPAALEPGTQDYVRIAISDTGVGIPEEKLERIFDSFYQVDGSSTREYGGTGLGLAIARSLVEAHRGSIKVESARGSGSTFTILLPVSHET
jgi:signal transduction histidine kinase